MTDVRLTFDPAVDAAAIRAQREAENEQRITAQDAHARRMARAKADAQEQWPAVLAALDGVTDPGLRLVLDHHRRDRDRRRFEEAYDCYGCDSCCQTAGWPCSTTEKIIEHLGLTAPGWQLLRAADGSTDAKETP